MSAAILANESVPSDQTFNRAGLCSSKHQALCMLCNNI